MLGKWVLRSGHHVAHFDRCVRRFHGFISGLPEEVESEKASKGYLSTVSSSTGFDERDLWAAMAAS